MAAARAWDKLAASRNGKSSHWRRAAQQYRRAGERKQSEEIYACLAASEKEDNQAEAS